MRDALKTEQISITLDVDVLAKIDKAAEAYGVKRQDLIRMWIGEKIKVLIGEKQEEKKPQ